MLKQSNYQEAIIGLIMTVVVNFLKNYFASKSSNMRNLLIAGIGWAFHYLIRKYIMNDIKSKKNIKNN